MPWFNVVIHLDVDKPDAGTACAEWSVETPPVSLDPPMLYAARATVSGQGAQQFKAEAEEFRDAELIRRTANANLAVTLLSILNA